MKLSVVIPAHNEEGNITETVEGIVRLLSSEQIDHEVLVVNDSSTDSTEAVLQGLSAQYESVRYVNNFAPNGFGLAIRKGLSEYRGDAVAIVMGDASDAPEDIVAYWRQIEAGYECVFGSRFIKGSQVIDYPVHKLILNRMANAMIGMFFGLRFNDITNAFKMYRREVVDAAQPLVANHFNLTVELPLKAIVRGAKWTVVPISWRNRKTGISKLKIREMGSRYLFIMLTIWLERHLALGDYNRTNPKAKVSESPAKR